MNIYEYSEKKDTRSGFGDGLTELGKSNPNVVALCADLTGSLKMNEFKKNHPERFFQVGVAEANMIGIAAGLTIGGKIPFTGTFANFSTGRGYDQIRQSIAYSGKNVKKEGKKKSKKRKKNLVDKETKRGIGPGKGGKVKAKSKKGRGKKSKGQ